MQEQIAEKQKESLSYQRELAANGSMLSQALDASRASVRDDHSHMTSTKFSDF